ncbi:MAG TPA: efflux RND transporter periplasmic adaptor subunit [Prevotella sp.]|nr:efflux RND transporter periplasmic adaptor subunit [Prevotella sp.]
MNRTTLMMLAISIVLMTTSCKSSKGEKDDTTVYTVTTPEVATTSITKDYVANIQSQKNIEIRAQEQGILQDIYVDEGQTVKAGQPLFRIAIIGSAQEVAKSKAEAEQANIDLQNTSKLVSNNIVSRNAKRMAKAKLSAALADYNMARIHQQLAVIHAPFAGILGRIPNKRGSLIQNGDLLTNLSDNTNMFIYFNVSEPEYLDYQMHVAERSKLPLKLILANGETFPTKGFIENIEGEFDSETGNIPFRAKFANYRHILRNGETGTVRMNIPKRNAIIIPQQSTYELQDKKYVFIVDHHGFTHATPVEIADEQQNVYIISKGLKSTDRILVDGVQKVKDGQFIKTRYKSPVAVISSLQLKAN